MSTFRVGPYDCYICEYNGPTASVMLVDLLPILNAERAVSTVARMLKTSDLELVFVKGTNRYACKINNVSVKELIKWRLET